MASLDACIVDKCKEAWTEEFITGLANKDNCSGFVKAVAKKLGVPLKETANADEIVDEIDGSWTQLPSGKSAAESAALGKFVVAGLESVGHTPARGNGHVVIIVGGKLYRDKYPMCWGGSIGSAQSQGTKSVGEVWNRRDRDSVKYFGWGTAAVCKV